MHASTCLHIIPSAQYAPPPKASIYTTRDAPAVNEAEGGGGVAEAVRPYLEEAVRKGG